MNKYLISLQSRATPEDGVCVVTMEAVTPTAVLMKATRWLEETCGDEVIILTIRDENKKQLYFHGLGFL